LRAQGPVEERVQGTGIPFYRKSARRKDVHADERPVGQDDEDDEGKCLGRVTAGDRHEPMGSNCRAHRAGGGLPQKKAIRERGHPWARPLVDRKIEVDLAIREREQLDRRAAAESPDAEREI
jgi:hypothetical protein